MTEGEKNHNASRCESREFTSFSKKMADNQSKSVLKGSDILRMLCSNDEVETHRINTMTTKIASSFAPKYVQGENIHSFCDRINFAWDFCNKEGYPEAKFCKLIRLSLPLDAGEVYDNLPSTAKNDVAEITKALIEALDKPKSEHLRDFTEIQKSPIESYTEYARRILRNYKRGTGAEILSGGEHVMLCEKFLQGLPTKISTSLRLVCSEEEMQNIEMLAKKASRCSPNRNLKEEVNHIRQELKALKMVIGQPEDSDDDF